MRSYIKRAASGGPDGVAQKEVVGITIDLIPGEYTASSRLISSRVTQHQAAEPQAGTDRRTGTRSLSRLDVCFGPNFVRSTPNSGRSRDLGWTSAYGRVGMWSLQVTVREL